MKTFELDLAGPPAGAGSKPDGDGLGDAVLLHNARWFIRLRWTIVGIFVVLGLVPGILRGLGAVPARGWPWALACTLAAANAVFTVHVDRLSSETPHRTVEANIWAQIALDLTVVTVLVHIVGSTQTLIAFTYLFHVVLACVFLPRLQSLAVTALAAGLYVTCLGLEAAGVLQAGGVFLEPVGAQTPGGRQTVFFAASAIAIWGVVWYLVSALSSAVRRRDWMLDHLNEELRNADHEKNRIMLRTTHDLKAPFSGIESNIQVLRSEFRDQLPEEAQRILDRIQAKGHVLSERIREMLLLGELKSPNAQSDHIEDVDVRSLLAGVVDSLADKAKSRSIAVRLESPALSVASNKQLLAILFSNLVANAVLYSEENGVVTVKASVSGNTVSVSVADHGIGIRAEALPHVFDEYYRTKEAAEFNRQSTGLGLAIVKTVAEKLDLKLRVASGEGEGTTFRVVLPARRGPG